MGRSEAAHHLESDDFDPWDSDASSQGSSESARPLVQHTPRGRSRSRARQYSSMAFPARMSLRPLLEGRHDNPASSDPSLPMASYRQPPSLTPDSRGQTRGTPSLGIPLNEEFPPTEHPSYFGEVPTRGPWCDVERLGHAINHNDIRLESRIGPPSTPATWTPELLHTRGASSMAWRSSNTGPIEDTRSPECRKRNASRDFQRPYLKEMAAAHAENCEPNVQIPVNSSAGRDESAQMIEMRKGKNKTQRTTEENALPIGGCETPRPYQIPSSQPNPPTAQRVQSLSTFGSGSTASLSTDF
ncbi:hypothetical protein KC19_VG113100 [Ceratodon purpureus]|uniref:Uncharacterized protein n=1 Tax=Ceratodon purpureus TaxID=3225 RepID=A0A8T0HPB9_CERPU|nr:hypothetical protein KC19_VG113100 [Ceratodon purpureus]